MLKGSLIEVKLNSGPPAGYHGPVGSKILNGGGSNQGDQRGSASYTNWVLKGLNRSKDTKSDQGVLVWR